MYMELVMLDRQQYIQQKHKCLSRVPLSLRRLQIPAELTKVGGSTVRSLKFYLELGELTEEWRDSIIVSIYKKGNKTDFS
jgi:hypothetical protein